MKSKPLNLLSVAVMSSEDRLQGDANRFLEVKPAMEEYRTVVIQVAKEKTTQFGMESPMAIQASGSGKLTIDWPINYETTNRILPPRGEEILCPGCTSLRFLRTLDNHVTNLKLTIDSDGSKLLNHVAMPRRKEADQAWGDGEMGNPIRPPRG